MGSVHWWVMMFIRGCFANEISAQVNGEALDKHACHTASPQLALVHPPQDQVKSYPHFLGITVLTSSLFF